MPATCKGEYAAKAILESFLRRPSVYFWTFTFAECLGDKAIAELRAGKLFDALRNRGASWVHVWELQQRGAWHLHLLTDKYLDVKWLRPWMVRRGWGPMMRVERLHDEGGRKRVGRYLAKYLQKGGRFQRWLAECRRRECEGRMSLEDAQVLDCAGAPGRQVKPDAPVLARKKLLGCSRSARVANTRFGWNPWTSGRPGSYLYFVGRAIFLDLEGRLPEWGDIGFCIRLGYEDVGFGDFDFLYQPP